MNSFREIKEPNDWVKFRLLMWKNFLLQWRQRKQTVIEFLLPVLTMSLVLLIRSQIEPVQNDVMSYPSLRADSLILTEWVMQGMDVDNLYIAYSPKSPVLEAIIKNVAIKIVNSNLEFIARILKGAKAKPDSPKILRNNYWSTSKKHLRNRTSLRFGHNKLIKVISYNRAALLNGIYIKEEKTHQVIAAVQFSDKLSGATKLPSKVSFALRFPHRPRLNSFYGDGGNSWKTDSLFPNFEFPGPRWPYSWNGGNDPGYVNEIFTALQHFVSTEVIAEMTSSNLDSFDVHIRRYPHPAHVLDISIEVLKMLFPMFIMLSFSYTAANLVRAITMEKELQLKETMKIMGLPTWLYWMAWFWKQYLYLMISTVLIVTILKVHWFKTTEGFQAYAVFTKTPWTVLIFFISMFLASMIFFCFMLTSFFAKGSTAALFTGIIWFVIYIPSFMFGMDASLSPSTQAVSCLSVVSAMAYGFQMLLAKESTGGMRWGQFFFNPSEESKFVFGHVILMMFLDCIIFMIITLYMEQVLPGAFGSPQPWNFFLNKDYWFGDRKNKKYVDNTVNLHENGEQSNQNIVKENDPTGLPTGVILQNLTKTYGTNTVVDNLSLNIYDDQITVLLGHNGAGKSTTISMLTGNVRATHGTVIVSGYDMVNNPRAARAYVGLCPQHNVLFDLMTVREHLEFFSRLKGFSGVDLQEEIAVMIKKLELEDKRDYLSQGLSGGQKRRLAVGIALCGGAKVVLLDEPTSGMDPSSRRALWDLLQHEKKGRSMILTTHFMDEADILGDRVAIMANGRLQCVGSPYFLKQHYGVGYTLVIAKKDGFKSEDCTELIKKYIPETTIKEDRGSEVTYSLPNRHSDKFQSLLSDLERNNKSINYQAYGLVATTLEDVFMSVGADLISKTNNLEDEQTDGRATIDSLVRQDNGDIKGWPLLRNHILAMWLKLWLIWIRFWPAVVLQLLVPILIMNAVLASIHYVMHDTSVIKSRELTVAKGYTSTETLLSFNGSSPNSLGAKAKGAYEKMFASMKLTHVENENVDDYYLIRASDENEYTKIRHTLLIGATFSDSSATAWFSNFGYHDVANTLNHVYQAILKGQMPNASFTVYNHPLQATYKDDSDLQLMLSYLSMQLCFGIGSSLAIVSAVFIMFYIKERTCRAKLLQKAAGVRPVTLWGSAAVFDWSWFIIICIPIFISCAAFDIVGVSSLSEIGRLCVCFMVYGAAMLPFTYLCSCAFKVPAAGFVSMFFLNLLLGMLGPQIVETLLGPTMKSKNIGNALDSILQYFPLYSLITCVRYLNNVGLKKWSCYQSCDYLKAGFTNFTECSMKLLCKFYPDQCCDLVDYSVWNWKKPGILRYFSCMVLMSVVFWASLMVVEHRLLRKYFKRKKILPPLDESTMDDDVLQESKKVDTIANSNLRVHSLVAHKLAKYYNKYLAVNQVSFTVEDRQCFGLLGVNGAGKTTTFKMLMGDELISGGDAFVSGHSVKKDITKVYRHIGYCPQFEAVFEEFTGRETLKFFSMLRGLASDVASSRTDMLADALGFKRHLDKRVDQYSGGTKRKLSTAVALLGDTRLVFVDEPTTGVDPAAKRQMWTAIQDAQRAGRGIVLTSHSMEECEALCTALTIMVNGQFQCIGAPQHLKNKFSQGFTLTIKVKMEEKTTKSQTETNKKKNDSIKQYVDANFRDTKIMEEYEGLLTYYLPDRNMTWSEIFGIMEKAKAELNIEDYKISQTTLEQIFLQFTKYQKQESG